MAIPVINTILKCDSWLTNATVIDNKPGRKTEIYVCGIEKQHLLYYVEWISISWRFDTILGKSAAQAATHNWFHFEYSRFRGIRADVVRLLSPFTVISSHYIQRSSTTLLNSTAKTQYLCRKTDGWIVVYCKYRRGIHTGSYKYPVLLFYRCMSRHDRSSRLSLPGDGDT